MSLATLFVTVLLPNLEKFLWGSLGKIFLVLKNLFELPKNPFEKSFWKITLENFLENLLKILFRKSFWISLKNILGHSHKPFHRGSSPVYTASGNS